MEFAHKSVLLNEVIQGLNIKPEGIYVDGTLGGGGHSGEILKRLVPQGRLLGIDRDEDAIEAASERLKEYPNFKAVRSNYSSIMDILKAEGIDTVDGILLDLGVSSHQFDEGERGFSYRFDSELDMRMDRRQTLTAKDVVNSYSREELIRILRDYGEEKFAVKIADRICKVREIEKITTTFQLNEIIKSSIPAKMRQKGHPSKQSFQAIRIEVNNELGELRTALNNLVNCLGNEGRLAIITFHSLEDRMVKQAFREWENPCTCPPGFPVCVCGKKSLGKSLTRKPILPSDEEMAENSRSKSSKLRIFVRKV